MYQQTVSMHNNHCTIIYKWHGSVTAEKCYISVHWNVHVWSASTADLSTCFVILSLILYVAQILHRRAVTSVATLHICETYDYAAQGISDSCF